MDTMKRIALAILTVIIVIYTAIYTSYFPIPENKTQPSTMKFMVWSRTSSLNKSHSTIASKKKKSANPSIEVDISHANRQFDVDLRILVMTFNRPWSLKRLLTSLNEADFLGEKVVVEVWIDRSKKGDIHELTYTTANNFTFRKGILLVLNHTRHVGIYGQWMGTWQPTIESKEIALLLEDDMVLSPIGYRYLKKVHKKYDSVGEINGFALHCSINLGTGKGHIIAPSEHIVFLYQIIGTWGFSPKKTHWMNFTKWYKNAYIRRQFQPLVPGIIPSTWYRNFVRSGRAHTMWEMWIIFYSWENKEYSLYPNLPKCVSLTRNFREIGLHFKSKSKILDPLLTTWNSRFDNLPREPIHLDYKGKVIG